MTEVRSAFDLEPVAGARGQERKTKIRRACLAQGGTVVKSFAFKLSVVLTIFLIVAPVFAAESTPTSSETSPAQEKQASEQPTLPTTTTEESSESVLNLFDPRIPAIRPRIYQDGDLFRCGVMIEPMCISGECECIDNRYCVCY